MPAVSSIAYFKRVGHHFAHPALVNVAHGEDMDARLLDDFSFLRVEIPRTDNHDVARLGFGLESQQVHQLGCAVTHNGRQRHPVNVPRRRRFRCIHVPVRVQPQVPDLFFFFAKMVGNTGSHARRN